MESLLATVLLAVPLIAWLGGTFLFGDSLLKLAQLSSAARELPNLPEILFSRNRLAPGFESGRSAVDEVSR